MKRRVFIALIFMATLFGTQVMAEQNAKTQYWIDVRSADEYAGGHYSAAVNIPHTEIAARIGEVTDDKNADIHVYCRSGRRSGIAKETLEKMGYTQVTNEGGYSDVLKKMK
ncbi:rhodanese-like domain-containing protein [Teredinibacter turnerae]|uniref:rhodanese-like domain-containing protein n=1 Tax=Teredinibacter turnerae TaxID=2426 RepID=UPI0005A28E50|nr:rhodanese-like domain-containing protein [Teredinibacter turnerae]